MSHNSSISGMGEPVQAIREINEKPLLQIMVRIHLQRVGWRNFFSSCAVVSVFWFLAGNRNRFWCYLHTHLEYNTAVALC